MNSDNNEKCRKQFFTNIKTLGKKDHVTKITKNTSLLEN